MIQSGAEGKKNYDAYSRTKREEIERVQTHTRNNTHKLQLERSNVMESVEACQQSP